MKTQNLKSPAGILFIAGKTALIILSLLVAFNLYAKPKTVKLNSKALEHFNGMHSGTNVKWTITDKYIKAAYMENSKEINLLYNVEGEFIGTKKKVTRDELPMLVENVLNTDFASYSVDEIAEFIDANNQWAYYISLKKPSETRFIKIDPEGFASTLKKIKNK